MLQCVFWFTVAVVLCYDTYKCRVDKERRYERLGNALYREIFKNSKTMYKSKR